LSNVEERPADAPDWPATPPERIGSRFERQPASYLFSLRSLGARLAWLMQSDCRQEADMLETKSLIGCGRSIWNHRGVVETTFLLGMSLVGLMLVLLS
jgi:hypothetical protein